MYYVRAYGRQDARDGRLRDCADALLCLTRCRTLSSSGSDEAVGARAILTSGTYSSTLTYTRPARTRHILARGDPRHVKHALQETLQKGPSRVQRAESMSEAHRARRAAGASDGHLSCLPKPDANELTSSRSASHVTLTTTGSSPEQQSDGKQHTHLPRLARSTAVRAGDLRSHSA